MPEEDPRIKVPGICGVTIMGASGIEWICIRKVHQIVYHRRVSDRSHTRGDMVFAENPNSAFHYVVPRWPGRPTPSERS